MSNMIHTLLLGHYITTSSTRPFYLYRIGNTPLLLFKLVDIYAIFKLPQSTQAQLESLAESIYQDQQHQIYILTTALVTIAIKHNKFILAELCKLKLTDYSAHLADSILSNIPQLQCSTHKKDKQYQPTDIQLKICSPIKSDTPISIGTTSTGAGSHNTKNHSRSLEESQPYKKHKSSNETDALLPRLSHTMGSQHQPPTLLSKRLKQMSGGKNSRNLTISTPSYGHTTSGIRSAPLNSNFRGVNQRNGPHPLSQIIQNHASPRTPDQASTSEFAIPPIVPSQQQPPHTAHPSMPHFPPHSPQTSHKHTFPPTPGRIPMDSKTPTHGSFHRQQFMQPFEQLFDTIETTRTLKSTLDDQIRKSSSLMQTLQASSATIEGLVRSQMKETHKDIMSRIEESVQSLLNRVVALEKKLNIPKQDYHISLDSLRDRIDKLERQLDP
ncbi:hypothetical protein BDB01DRAFT_799660 [Pilobolus umbonatus]|nr:hypothetical protein BDB01DRAFT_799660 [Pilobolus umbonatus]